MQRRLRSLSTAGLLCLVTLWLYGSPAEGHAICLESSPAPQSAVAGPNVSIRLRFNVRVDGTRSRLVLLLPNHATQALVIQEQSAADTLIAQAIGLQPSDYRIRWQVLAADGHITRGEIPFRVSAS